MPRSNGVLVAMAAWQALLALFWTAVRPLNMPVSNFAESACCWIEAVDYGLVALAAYREETAVVGCLHGAHWASHSTFLAFPTCSRLRRSSDHRLAAATPCARRGLRRRRWCCPRRRSQSR